MEESRAFWSLLSDLEEEEAARASLSQRQPPMQDNSYQEVLNDLEPTARELLEDYTAMRDEQMIPHVLYCVSRQRSQWKACNLTSVQRDRAWRISPSDFVGQFDFTVPNI